MKRLFLTFLFLLIACPAWATNYFPFVAGETEVRTYFALPNPTGTVKDLNAQIKTLKAGGSIVLPSVTGNISNLSNYQFITNPSSDLRKWIGYFITLNDGTYNLKIFALSAGTGQTYGSNVNNADFATDEPAGTSWTRGTGWTISGGVAVASSAASTIWQTTTEIGALYQIGYDLISRTSGDASIRFDGTTYYKTSTPQNGLLYYLTASSASTSGFGGHGGSGFSGTIDNAIFRKVLTPSATGITYLYPSVDTGFNYKATSYTATINNTDRIFLNIGDSKTAGDTWQQILMSAIDIGLYIDKGVPGATIESYATNIGSVLSTISVAPYYVLINLGANGISPHNETSDKANFQTIINAIHTKWPSAKIYLAKPWIRGYNAECLELASWIDELISANTGIVFSGTNENVWLEGGDNGATMTDDGTHYSSAGETENATQWKAVLGL